MPGWRYKRKGFYSTQSHPERIQRFTCLACRRTFSCQTFHVSYWLKRPELLKPIFRMVTGCMCNRQIAEALECSHSTVALQVAHLARHCMLFQARELERIDELPEIVIDGLESFEVSKYFPFNHDVAVDVATSYFLYHTDSELRRKGRMTACQKVRRAQLEETLGRADPKAVENSVYELLETVTAKQRQITVRSDEHKAYPRAIARLACDIDHHQTSSEERRDKNNPLFEVNLLDLIVRHGSAHHKRETIAYTRRRQASAEKLAIFQVWRNYVRKRHVNGRRVTPAMLLGLKKRMLRLDDILAERMFVDKVRLPARWRRYYWREIDTRALPVNRRHDLTYAF